MGRAAKRKKYCRELCSCGSVVEHCISNVNGLTSHTLYIYELIYPRFNLPVFIELFRQIPKVFLGWVESAVSDPVCLLASCDMLYFTPTGNPEEPKDYWVIWQWAELWVN